MKLHRNPERSGLIAGLAILAVGAFFILLPLLANLDMMETGFGMQCGGLFLVIVGGVTTATFSYRVRRLREMLRGDRVLAHWVYDPAQLHEQAARDLEGTKSRNQGLFLIVAAFFVVFTSLFVMIGALSGEGENMPLFAGIMGAVLLIVAAFAFGMPYLQHRRALRSSGEAVIAEEGLFINGVLHTWNAPLAMLDGVALADDGDQARLVFHLRSLSRASATAYETYSVEVPVPRGEEATARRVEGHFRERSK